MVSILVVTYLYEYFSNKLRFRIVEKQVFQTEPGVEISIKLIDGQGKTVKQLGVGGFLFVGQLVDPSQLLAAKLESGWFGGAVLLGQIDSLAKAGSGDLGKELFLVFKLLRRKFNLIKQFDDLTAGVNGGQEQTGMGGGEDNQRVGWRFF